MTMYQKWKNAHWDEKFSTVLWGNMGGDGVCLSEVKECLSVISLCKTTNEVKYEARPSIKKEEPYDYRMLKCLYSMI